MTMSDDQPTPLKPSTTSNPSMPEPSAALQGRIVLRPAIGDDVPAITDCVNAAYAKWVPRVGRKPAPMLDDYAEVVKEADVVVAEFDGDFAGLIVLRETDDGFLVENVAVLPAYAGRGIGRVLLSHADTRAAARGHASLYLYTNEKMVENIALYVRLGYVETERRQEEGFRRVFMRKSV